MKTIPQNLETEEVVLSGIFLSKDSIYKINLAPEDFNDPKRRKIFQAILTLRDKREPIDIVSVGEELGKSLKGIGGHTYLAYLVNRITTATNIESHAKKLKELSYKRDLLWKLKSLEEAVYKDEDIEKRKHDLIETGVSDLKAETIKDLAHKFEKYYQEPIEKGIMTGIPKIDKITNGFRAGEIVTFTSDTGIGKTNMLLNVAIHNLKLGKKVMYVNMEMDTNDILTRMIAMYNDLSASKIRGKYEDTEKVLEGLGEMYDANFKLVTNAKVRSSEIIQQAYIEKMKDGLDVLIVDYLNEINDDKSDEKINLNIATSNLNDGSIRLEVPIVTAYQMTQYSRRENATPKKGDSRGSSVVSDRATMMFAMVNESMQLEGYNPLGDTDDEMKIHVLKNRNGSTGFAFNNIYLNKKSLNFYEKQYEN